jgi:tripartite-type tricarboxylate transporter receptor subunit TctC
VTNVGTGAQAAAIRHSLPTKTLPEFIAYAKAHPGKLNYTTGGVNNLSHLGPVLMFRKAGIELVHVPARGEPQAITDLLSGSVDFYFGNTSVLLGSDLEKIRLLAVGSANRLPGAPHLPTVAETIPGFEFASWNGFFVPKGTPEATIEKMRAAIVELVSTPAMKDKLIKLGIVPGGQSREEVAATFKKDAASFAEAVAAAGIKKPEAK